jgi:glycosyltransferase involved in cell wall biosynthesis
VPSDNQQTAKTVRPQADHNPEPREKRGNRTTGKIADHIVVMQLILNLEIGGAQEVVRTLVKYLASGQCTPVVCTFGDGPVRRQIEALGVPVEILPQRKYSVVLLPLFIADMVRIWKALAAVVRKYDVDVVQTHLLTILDYLALALRYTTPVRAVYWTFHSFQFELARAQVPHLRWLYGPKRAAHRLLYRWAANLVDAFIAISEQVGQALVDVIGPIGHKVAMIPNGVDTERYGLANAAGHVDRGRVAGAVRAELGLDDETRLIAMVGTLKEVKGHCYMIRAMTELAPRFPDLHLLLVGDGELRASLEAQVADATLSHRIHFMGSRSDVPDLLAASDLFVLPSLWEGLSMALLEAMATGLPIVASEVSGTVQAIVPGEHGLLIPPGEPRAIVDAISALLSDPDRAHKMGAAARARVNAEFSARKQAQDHLELYDRTLAGQ